MLDFRQMQAFTDDPVVFVRDEGVRIQDDTGRWYLDGPTGVFVHSLGFGNDRVLTAAMAQLRQLHFAPPPHGTNPPALTLSDLLRRVAPVTMR